MNTPRHIALPNAATQFTLGDFIDALKSVDPDKPVFTDFGEALRGETQLFDCYAGHPDELAIAYRPPMRDDRQQCAESIMERAYDAIDCTFIDYSGDEHTMSRDTPLWVANWCYDTGNAVAGVDELPDIVIVRTWKIE